MADINDVKELIERSGNNFHAKVARWLSDNGWHVVVSPYYLDQVQNKAREIDIIAEKDWPIYGGFHDRPVGEVVVRLFIECKYLSGHSVFWFADKDRSSATDLVCSSTPFRVNNSYTEKHHYLSQGRRVAKVFSSSKARNEENEPFYKALNQSLNGMVSMYGLPVSIPDLKKGRKVAKAVLKFPVIVCNSFADLYAVDFYNDSTPQSISENFQIEVRYAYVDAHERRRNDYFLLDVVEYDKLDDYVEALDEDANAAATLAG